jgi:RNA polymerase sigma-70 factor (ECF subfamily)
MWQKRQQFQKINDLKAYLYRSVHNRCMNHLLKEKQTKERLEAIPISQPLTETQYDNMVRAEMLNIIVQKIDSLPASISDVIKLHYLSGKNIHEIAAILGIPVNTVKSRRLSGIQQLRRMLPGYFSVQLLMFLINSRQ